MLNKPTKPVLDDKLDFYIDEIEMVHIINDVADRSFQIKVETMKLANELETILMKISNLLGEIESKSEHTINEKIYYLNEWLRYQRDFITIMCETKHHYYDLALEKVYLNRENKEFKFQAERWIRYLWSHSINEFLEISSFYRNKFDHIKDLQIFFNHTIEDIEQRNEIDYFLDSISSHYTRLQEYLLNHE